MSARGRLPISLLRMSRYTDRSLRPFLMARDLLSTPRLRWSPTQLPRDCVRAKTLQEKGQVLQRFSKRSQNLRPMLISGGTLSRTAAVLEALEALEALEDREARAVVAALVSAAGL